MLIVSKFFFLCLKSLIPKTKLGGCIKTIPWPVSQTLADCRAIPMSNNKKKYMYYVMPTSYCLHPY